MNHLSLSITRHLLFMAAVSSAVSAHSQLSSQNFEDQILAYEPKMNPSITDDDYEFAKMVIRETKVAVSDDEDGFNRADYFNVLTAFLSLNESKEHIDLAYEKFKNSEGSCEYFTSFADDFIQKATYEPVRDRWINQAKICNGEEVEEEVFSIEAYCDEHDLNQALIKKLLEIDEKDQQYRGSDYEQNSQLQAKEDRENQLTIEELYAKYGAYIGTSLAGPKFEHVMWEVIQHSNKEMMKNYLPVMKEAHSKGEMAEAMLKMTIDRYYGLEYGYQVFGSQAGMNIDFADDATREQIAKEYGVKY
ncbi:MAG: hypothetical protein AAGC47_08365 [Bacteroidota bacterium]